VRRIKILVGVCLLLIAFFGVTASKDLDAKPVAKITPTISKQFLVDQRRQQYYKLRQDKLKVALKNYFNRAIASGTIVGAGVSIVKGDSILVSEGYGRRKVNSSARVNGETIFRLGSLSKGFAGVLAASLQAEGKLDWNDRVVDYIPGFQFGNQSNTDKVTLAHILSHTSGTPYHSFTNLIEEGLPVSKIAQRFNEVKPIAAPGQIYSYQNAMFSLSQEVTLKATGRNMKTSLQTRFFKPLGMSSISMDHNSLLQEENVAFPHAKRRKGWRILPLKNGYYNAVAAGGINANSIDMAKWMRFLLGHNPEVLPAATIQNAFKPFIALNNNNKYYQRWPGHLQSHYGFGWRIHNYSENGSAANFKANPNTAKTIWHHGGSVNSYRNEIALFPDDDIGICVLLNSNSRLAKTVIPELFKIVKDNLGSSH